MICWLIGLSPGQIEALRHTPTLASDLAPVAEENSAAKGVLEDLMSRMAPEDRAQFEAMNKETEVRLAPAQARLAAIGPFETALSLQKSWHILHYLLTGHLDGASAPGNILMSGEELGDDVGYGPPRLHSEKETDEFARFLQAQELDRLQQRIKFKEMSRLVIYGVPSGRGVPGSFEREVREEVATYFPRLRDYVAKMASKEYGVLTWLS
jgi:hypothetical protein